MRKKHFEVRALVSYWTVADDKAQAVEQLKKQNLQVHEVTATEVKIKK